MESHLSLSLNKMPPDNIDDKDEASSKNESTLPSKTGGGFENAQAEGGADATADGFNQRSWYVTQNSFFPLPLTLVRLGGRECHLRPRNRRRRPSTLLKTHP